MYVIPINDLGVIIYRHLTEMGYHHAEVYRDHVLYTILTDILKDEMGYNLLRISSFKNNLNVLELTTSMKIWKDYLWKSVITSITVDHNLLYYVDIMVNKGSLYIKLEESV